MNHDHSNSHSKVLSEIELRVKALESLSVEKGLDSKALDALIETLPLNRL